MNDNKNKFFTITNMCFIAAILALVVALLLALAFNAKPKSPYMAIHDIYADDSTLDTKVKLQGYYSNSLINNSSNEEDEEHDSDTSASSETNETVYHFLTAFDETKCCSITIEFVSSNGDYPGLGDYIEVEGIYSRYSEGTNTYSTVKDAVWKHIDAPK